MHPPSDHTDALMDLAFRFGRLMRQRMACLSKEVNWVQIHALILLEEHEGLTMKALAQELKITSPSATSFVQRLVESGWVERYSDPTNRKEVHLRLSAKGKDVLSKKKAERAAVVRGLLSRIPQEDQQHLLRILGSLAEESPQ